MTTPRPAAQKFRRWMAHVPDWTPTILCLAAILWLTLAPEPLGDTDVMLFPGFDKVAHAIMFFGLTLCMLFDFMRSRGWHKQPLALISLICFIGAGTGIGIEYLQQAMQVGRSLEFWDMAADSAGAITAGAFWIMIRGIIAVATDNPTQKD